MAVAVPSSSRRRSLRRGPRERTDDQLVVAIGRGDLGAFDELYERHHRPLLAFCRHMLGTREEAEDALQLVFVSAHARFVEPEPVTAVRAFLYAVARNRCLSVLRARRDVVALELVAEPATDGLALESEVERRADLRELLGDLGRLPEDQRAALVLAELQDLSHDEIAVALDVRTDKVKALVFQAREALLSRRTARGADCRVIQEQLATLRGSALRRKELRRHVELCGACAAFEAEVGRQRAAFALILPVVPSLALKNGILAALGSGGGAAAAGVGAGVGASTVGVLGGSGVVAKGAAILALAGGAAGGGAVVATRDSPPAPKEQTAAPRSSPGSNDVPGSVAPRVVLPAAAARTTPAGPKTPRPKSKSKPSSPGRSVAAKQAAAAKRERVRAAGRERAEARRAARAARVPVTKPRPVAPGRPAPKAAAPVRAAGKPADAAPRASKAKAPAQTPVAPVSKGKKDKSAIE